MKRILLFLPLVIAVAIGIFLAAGIGKDPTKFESARIGKPVPEFSLQSLDDPEQILDASLLKARFHCSMSGQNGAPPAGMSTDT